MVKQISQYLSIKTIEPGDGTVSVFIGGGQRLVLAGEAQQLTVEAEPFDSQRSRLALVQQGGNLPLNENLVAGGSGKKTCRLGEDEICSHNSLRVAVSTMINQLVQQLGSQVSLVLASSSPRRLEILGIIGLKPEARFLRHGPLHCRTIA